MSNKSELSKNLKKLEPVAKKAEKQLAKAFKVAKDESAKMLRVAQAQIDIQMKNLQKEKIYHEIGKYIAAELMKGKLDMPGLDKYKKRIEKIDSVIKSDQKKVKKEMTRKAKPRVKSSKK
ncbi:MAG: hypothetical protein P9L88_01625 [Candidatus Tantalella remota]|nr:hypothetical protein [Candidatus Tantalella remota]